MAIIPLIFNFKLCVKALFVMNFYAISKNTNKIFLQCIVQEYQVRAPNHNLDHPENTYILISLIFYTGLDLNPTLLLYLHTYGRQMYIYRDI